MGNRNQKPCKEVLLRSKNCPRTPQCLVFAKTSSPRFMLTGSTYESKIFLIVSRMLPDMFLSPIHLFHMFILRKFIGEPGFDPERYVIGEFRSKFTNCSDIEMVIMTTPHNVRIWRKDVTLLTYQNDIGNGFKFINLTRRFGKSRRTNHLKIITFS